MNPATANLALALAILNILVFVHILVSAFPYDDKYGVSYYNENNKSVVYEYENIKYIVKPTNNNKICSYDKNVFEIGAVCDSDTPVNREVRKGNKKAYIDITPDMVISTFGEIKIEAVK